jgi:hypothetical protein
MAVESNGTFLIDSAMKAQQWELAKGHLRALVEIQGSYSTPNPEPAGTAKWERLQSAVKKFVTAVEDNGLHE